MITLLFIFIIISSLILGALVYKNNPRGQDNRYFLVFNILLVFWLVVNYLENENINEKFRAIFLHTDFIVSPIWGYFWFCFCYGFLEKKRINKKANTFFIFILSALIFIELFTKLIIKKIYFVNGVLHFDLGIGFIFLAGYILFCTVGGSLALLFKYRRFQGKKKIQTLYILIGFSLASSIAVIINLFFQEKLSIELFRLGSSSMVFIIIFTSYSIIKHQLLDIKIIIQRSLVYSIVLSFIIGIYLFLIFIAGFFFRRSVDLATAVITLVTTIISVYTVPLIERYFMRVTDYIFFKDKYDYSEALFDLSEVLNKNINLEVLLKKIAEKLKEIFKIEDLMIILPIRKIVLDKNGKIKTKFNRHIEGFINAIDDDKNLLIEGSDYLHARNADGEKNSENRDYKIQLTDGNKFHVAMTVPIRLDNRLIGVLAMGGKLSGDLYSPEDCNLLKTFSYQAAVALEKSTLYEKVKNYSVELEKEVKARTGEIKGLQEEQKLMMLEIAHGMQTPLTIIKGEMRNLEEHVEDKKDIEVLESTIDRISKFIYDMLKLARMENQGENFKKEKFNLSELVLELAESFEIICNDKDIKIEQDIAPDIYLLGDTSEIAELITNLASNSIKYMSDEREKIIRLELKKEADKIRLVLSDTGVGIDQEGLKKLFNRFYRVNDEAHAGKSGTGLGLAICKEIVTHHQGVINVESEKGKGTKFIIIFPEAK